MGSRGEAEERSPVRCNLSNAAARLRTAAAGCSFAAPDELCWESRVHHAVGELVGHIGGLVGWRHCRDASRASARECQSLEVGGDAGQGVGVAIGEDGAESFKYCEVVRVSVESGPQVRQKHAQCNGTP